jgi:hypothetical protein
MIHTPSSAAAKQGNLWGKSQHHGLLIGHHPHRLAWDVHHLLLPPFVPKAGRVFQG